MLRVGVARHLVLDELEQVPLRGGRWRIIVQQLRGGAWARGRAARGRVGAWARGRVGTPTPSRHHVGVGVKQWSWSAWHP